jgi:hypothetical protein
MPTDELYTISNLIIVFLNVAEMNWRHMQIDKNVSGSTRPGEIRGTEVRGCKRTK